MSLKARFQFGERVIARVLGCEVRAEVLGEAGALVSACVVDARRRELVGTTWAVRVRRLRRVEESGNLFEVQSGEGLNEATRA